MQVSKSGEAGAALSSTSLLGLDEQTKALLTVRLLLRLMHGEVCKDEHAAGLLSAQDTSVLPAAPPQTPS